MHKVLKPILYHYFTLFRCVQVWRCQCHTVLGNIKVKGTFTQNQLKNNRYPTCYSSFAVLFYYKKCKIIRDYSYLGNCQLQILFFGNKRIVSCVDQPIRFRKSDCTLKNIYKKEVCNTKQSRCYCLSRDFTISKINVLKSSWKPGD